MPEGLRAHNDIFAPSQMLYVKTYLHKSEIHGIGVFAAERIKKGTKIWRFIDGYDRAYTLNQFARLPEPAKQFLLNYAYRVEGKIILTVDHDRHINHSDNPNTCWRHGYIIARSNIPKGAEITNNYRMFDVGLCSTFLAKKKKPGKKRARRK